MYTTPCLGEKTQKKTCVKSLIFLFFFKKIFVENSKIFL